MTYRHRLAFSTGTSWTSRQAPAMNQCPVLAGAVRSQEATFTKPEGSLLQDPFEALKFGEQPQTSLTSVWMQYTRASWIRTVAGYAGRHTTSHTLNSQRPFLIPSSLSPVHLWSSKDAVPRSICLQPFRVQASRKSSSKMKTKHHDQRDHHHNHHKTKDSSYSCRSNSNSSGSTYL